MTDRREQILSRLLAVLKTIVGIKSVVRNRGELGADMRPAIALLDGNETARDPIKQQTGRLTLAPNLIDLSPELYLVMDSRAPNNDGLGEDMNALRVAILRAIISDAELLALIGSNGDIHYDGCETDLTGDGAKIGQMNMRLIVTYALRPSEL